MRPCLFYIVRQHVFSWRRTYSRFMERMEGGDNSASVQSADRKIEDWQTGWQQGQIGFHKPIVHPTLEMYRDHLLGDGQKRILVPLCGKTLDMKWLYDLGHTVVGVEGVEIAATSFFEENGIEATVTETDCKSFKVFSSQDKRLQFFLGDFFNCRSELCGSFDAVWDRAALVAVNPEDRKRYCEIINSLVRSGGKILLEALEYNPREYGGPPQHVPEYHIRELFEANCDVEVLHHDDVLQEWMKVDWGLSALTARNYLIIKD